MAEEIKKTLAALAALSITSLGLVEHDAVATSEEMEKALGDKLPGHQCKNLFMKDKKGKLYLIVIEHNRKLDLKKVAKQLKVAGNALRFEGAESLMANLGLVAGSVTPFGVMNDAKNAVTVVLDKKLQDETTIPVVIHPCTNTASIAVTFVDLVKFIEAQGNTLVVNDFDAELPKAEPKKAAPQQKKGGKKKGGKKQNSEEEDLDSKGMTASKKDNFPTWYQQAVKRTGLIEYYDISGCYILRPYSYRMWELIQRFFDDAIKQLDVENCYFPLFVSETALKAEADHIEGFAPEVAWVTKSGQSELPIPIAVRPTSETIMYPAYSKWIKSHRDLPLKLNQWSNVVRWEFKHPTPFIRSREFLWQEGHSAFATLEEAEEEVLQILELYASVYEDLLAVPVVKGKKTEEEKFAGGYYTTTVEAFVPAVGRGIQGATSHCLGDNFAKMFNIQFLNDKKEKQYVIQNSWGLTTRTIGVMIMVHGDDKGLVLPPRVAPQQVVIVPIYFKNSANEVAEHCKYIEKLLKQAGVRVKADVRENYNPGWKFNEYELKGVPLRLEVGPKDIEKKQVLACRRDGGDKFAISTADDQFVPNVIKALEQMQDDMLNKAKQERDDRMTKVTTWDNFNNALNARNMALAPWCGYKDCEKKIKVASGEAAQNIEQADAGSEGSDGTDTNFEALTGAAKSLCTPFVQPEMPEDTKCIYCDKKAINWTLFGRSY